MIKETKVMGKVGKVGKVGEGALLVYGVLQCKNDD